MSHVRAAVYYKQKYMKLLEEDSQKFELLEKQLIWDEDDAINYEVLWQRISLLKTIVEDLDNIIGD